jgi:hypothetical protein
MEENKIERATHDVAEDSADGLDAAVAGGVVGAHPGGGTTGTMAGAIVGQAVGRDVVENKLPEEEELPPLNYDALEKFSNQSGVADEGISPTQADLEGEER